MVWRDLVTALDGYSTAISRRPIATFQPLPGQHAVLTDPSRYRMFRGPNQALGKTTAGAIDTICSAIGDHPWNPAAVTPHPIEAWVLCASWSQSIAIQAKLWHWLPKDLLHPDVDYNTIRGFRGQAPSFQVRHIPSGGWSTIRIKTTQQGGINLSGASITRAWFDEPPASDRVYSEVQKRVMSAGSAGRVLITMTPVNAPVDWLRIASETGQIVDHHHRLEPAELIPVGAHRPLMLGDGTLCDADWVQAVIAETIPHEVPVVCHGEWSFAATDAIFTAYRRSGQRPHLIDAPPSQDVKLYIGLDHGTARSSQVALLIAVDPGAKGEQPRIWVVDEAVNDQAQTTPEQDAVAIFDMLDRNGIRWRDLTAVFGDRPHHGSNRRGSLAKKSNTLLAAALMHHKRGKAHGITRRTLHPPIRPAKRGAANQPGAVSYGCTWLHRQMIRDGHFHVLRRCVKLDESLQRYRMAPNSEWSHMVDALRYGLRDLIYGSRRRLPGRPVMVG